VERNKLILLLVNGNVMATYNYKLICHFERAVIPTQIITCSSSRGHNKLCIQWHDHFY